MGSCSLVRLRRRAMYGEEREHDGKGAERHRYREKSARSFCYAGETHCMGQMRDICRPNGSRLTGDGGKADGIRCSRGLGRFSLSWIERDTSTGIGRRLFTAPPCRGAAARGLLAT